jgi:hypothetical protein
MELARFWFPSTRLFPEVKPREIGLVEEKQNLAKTNNSYI